MVHLWANCSVGILPFGVDDDNDDDECFPIDMILTDSPTTITNTRYVSWRVSFFPHLDLYLSPKIGIDGGKKQNWLSFKFRSFTFSLLPSILGV
ncbi:hypothetical protein BLOT_002923 [Blomia tropicalis]|nr:hypothetical protein BLOT_002923 [Blomia tropicalis]